MSFRHNWYLCKVRNRGMIILLLVTMTINSLSLHQVLKLPVLVAHYFEHKQRGQAITVMEYLSMHYWGQDIDDNDHDRDMQLPFKKVDLSHSSMTLFVPSTFDVVSFDFPVKKSYAFPESDDIASNHLGSLFRPPRLS